LGINEKKHRVAENLTHLRFLQNVINIFVPTVETNIVFWLPFRFLGTR